MALNIDISLPLSLTSITRPDAILIPAIIKIRERTRYPIWALKNKFFPLKFVLRVVENMIVREKGGVHIQTLRKELKNLAFKMREEMEELDKNLENRRGNRFSAAFAALR